MYCQLASETLAETMSTQERTARSSPAPPLVIAMMITCQQGISRDYTARVAHLASLMQCDVSAWQALMSTGVLASHKRPAKSRCPACMPQLPDDVAHYDDENGAGLAHDGGRRCWQHQIVVHLQAAIGSSTLKMPSWAF